MLRKAMVIYDVSIKFDLRKKVFDFAICIVGRLVGDFELEYIKWNKIKY